MENKQPVQKPKYKRSDVVIVADMNVDRYAWYLLKLGSFEGQDNITLQCTNTYTEIVQLLIKAFSHFGLVLDYEEDATDVNIHTGQKVYVKKYHLKKIGAILR